MQTVEVGIWGQLPLNCEKIAIRKEINRSIFDLFLKMFLIYNQQLLSCQLYVITQHSILSKLAIHYNCNKSKVLHIHDIHGTTFTIFKVIAP